MQAIQVNELYGNLTATRLPNGLSKNSWPLSDSPYYEDIEDDVHIGVYVGGPLFMKTR